MSQLKGPSAPEEALVRRAKQRDAEAWTEIYHRHFPAVYAYILRRVGSVPVAEDLAARVFLEALERIGRFTYRGTPIVAWLFRIAHNLIVRHFRRQARRGEEPLDETMADSAASVEAKVELGFLREELRAALATLTEEQRRVVVLRFVEGLGTREAAFLLDKPEGAIKALQHRALASMRRFMVGGQGK